MPWRGYFYHKNKRNAKVNFFTTSRTKVVYLAQGWTFLHANGLRNNVQCDVTCRLCQLCGCMYYSMVVDVALLLDQFMT